MGETRDELSSGLPDSWAVPIGTPHGPNSGARDTEIWRWSMERHGVLEDPTPVSATPSGQLERRGTRARRQQSLSPRPTHTGFPRRRSRTRGGVRSYPGEACPILPFPPPPPPSPPPLGFDRGEATSPT